MKIKQIIAEIEKIAPLTYAEDFDNVGLLVGHPDDDVNGVLIAHDTLENVLDEAIEKETNLILSFHPIIFKGLKKLNGNTYVERVVMKAIKNNIAIYAIHTALDNQYFGISGILAEKLGLQRQRVLLPQTRTLRQLVTYVPVANAEKLRRALFDAGAGKIGKYKDCSFNVSGTGSFYPVEGARPYIGKVGKLQLEPEERISVVFQKHLQNKILNSLFENHPYEEVAYEIFELLNDNQEIGLGIVGDLPEPVDEMQFLEQLKKNLNLGCIRYSNLRKEPIRKVAVLGGSGAFAIEQAKRAGADIYITADIKYHEFYQGENQMLIADIGHFESEQFTKSFLFDFLTKKFSNFAVALSDSKTNPINYL